MDDFSVNGFDSKVSRSSSSPNEAVMSVIANLVKKPESLHILRRLISLSNPAFQDGRSMQLPIVVTNGFY